MVIDLSFGSRIATSMISRMLLNVCKAASATSYPITSTREEAFMNGLSSRFGTVSCRPAETLHECVSRPSQVEPCITLKQCSFGPGIVRCDGVRFVAGTTHGRAVCRVIVHNMR